MTPDEKLKVLCDPSAEAIGDASRITAFVGAGMEAVAEIERLRSALKFYADEANHKQSYIASRGFSVSEVICDNGRMARGALGEPERT